MKAILAFLSAALLLPAPLAAQHESEWTVVTLARDGELIRVHIRWKGGTTTSLEVSRSRSYFELIRTPAATIESIRALAAEQTDGQIAHILNSRLYRSGAGKSTVKQMLEECFPIPESNA